jgi:two-component system sensor histidine kinase CiaH
MFRAARLRLVAWNVSVLTCILIVLGGAVYYAFYTNIYKEVDQQLGNQELRVLTAVTQAAGDLYAIYSVPSAPFESSYRMIVTDQTGQVNMTSDCPPTINPFQPARFCPSDSRVPTSRDAIREALLKGRDLRTVWFRGEPQRVRTFPVVYAGVFEGVVQISRTAAGEQASLQDLGWLLIFGGLAGVVLSAFASLFLANKALVPIRQAFARQRQFTADASHELRTPLALIRANAEMLERHGDQLPDEDGELITEIIRETDHLNRLVGDLLTLARADTGQVQLVTQPFDLRELVSEVHEDVHRIAESRGIASHISLNGPVVVDGDETRLRQLLLILLDNALKYTDPGGEVDVALQREDGRARLSVSDTGIGIPSEDLPRIFDRFYRVDRAREHESGGTGLGLAIAQWIVQAHHGSIKVDSEAGQGTRFDIELPATQE